MSRSDRLRRCVVLLSGGLDSAVCLAAALKEGRACHALSFDYGQRHSIELAAAGRIAKAAGVSHKVIRLDLRAVGGSALTADVDVPKDQVQGGDEIPVTYVPARNLTFLSLALGYAETLDARELWIGVNAVDFSGYPDCRPEFIHAFEHAANLGTRAGVEHVETRGEPWFKVRMPLVDLSKAEIIRLGATLGVNFAATHSCYDPQRDLACGHCDSCLLRAKGFSEAGVVDPTQYAVAPTTPASRMP
jgi:7-cyano-7-deazaguanine synthase